MRPDGVAFRRRQVRVVVNDVEERFVDLANIVEERDSLDVSERPLVDIGGLGENERITSDAADVSAGLCVVGIDSA